MDFGALYIIEEAFLRGAVRAKEVADVVGARAIDLATGRWKPDAPLRFEPYEGTKRCDLMGTQQAAVCLISDRVRDALRVGRVSGWDTLSIAWFDGNGVPVHGYGLLVVTGRCGPVDKARSVRVDKWVVGNPNRYAPVWKGLYFAEDSWDGSDLFAPHGTAFVLATERAKNVLKRMRATNMDITALTDIERVSLI